MHVERQVVEVTTASDGTATAYSGLVTGQVLAVHYVKDDFADGVDVTLSSEATGETIWAEENVNASTSRAPRRATHSTAGVAALYAADGQAVLGPICLANDRIKIQIAQGGDTKQGTFHLVIGG